MRRFRASDVKGQVDFGIVTIRQDEFDAVLCRFTPWCLVVGERTYDTARLVLPDGRYYIAAVVRTEEQGHSAAHSAAADLIQDLDPTWMLLVGIAGAVPETEFTLGDVVLATRVHDFSVTAAKAGKTEYAMGGGPTQKVVNDLTLRLSAMDLGPWNSPDQLGDAPPVVPSTAVVVGDAKWQEKVRSALAANFDEGGSRRRAPKGTAVPIVSGNQLMKDPQKLQQWMEHARDLKAVEMELPAVYQAARRRSGDKPVLAVRGISDIVGLERDPAWTGYACQSAASLAYALVRTQRPVEPKPKAAFEGARSAVAGSRNAGSFAVHEQGVLQRSQPSAHFSVVVCGFTIDVRQPPCGSS